MPGGSNTLEEQLNEKGIVGWYIMKPNRVYAKDQRTARYITTDVIAEGTSEEIIEAIEIAGEAQLNSINTLGQQEVLELRSLESEYNSTKAVMIRACRSLRTYFAQQGNTAVVSILDTTIANLNAI